MLELYIWQKQQKMWWMQDEPDEYVIVSRDPEKIKQSMLAQVMYANRVNLHVVDGDYEKRGQLYLEVREGKEIPVKRKELHAVIKALYAIWRRPVFIRATVNTPYTGVDDILTSFDGKEVKEDGDYDIN